MKIGSKLYRQQLQWGDSMEYIKSKGKTLKLDSNALTLLHYKKEFRSDFFADLLKLSKSTSVFKSDETKEEQKNQLDNIAYSDLENLDMILVYQFFWAMAKTANRNIKSFWDFMEMHSDLLLVDILPPLKKLIEKSFKTKKK